MLTTGLDNLLGTNGNDVVLAVLDGADSTLELDDAFNALMGQDTLRLDVLEDATFDSADYHMVGFERVLVQGRADDLDVEVDLADMSGVDLEVRNLVGPADGADDASLEAFNIGGDVLVTNFDGNYIILDAIGGDVAINSVEVDGDIVIGATDEDPAETTDWVGGSVAGDVTLADVTNVDDIAVFGLGGSLSLSSVNSIDYLEVQFADGKESGVINLDGVTTDDNVYVGGADLTSLVINATGEASDLDEIDLEFDTEDGDINGVNSGSNVLDSVTINASADLVIGNIDLADDANGNNVTTSLTINGAAAVEINGFNGEDFVDVVYTGSGSLVLGQYDDNGQVWDPVVASFNASTATGGVTVYLDLNESLNDELDSLDFTYVGSKGSDRVVIEEDSLGEAAADLDVIRLSIDGGAGTDTLVVLDDTDLSAAALSKVSGFEVVELTGFGEGDTYDLTNAGEFTSVALSSDINSNFDVDVTVSKLSATQAQNITINYDGYTVFRDEDGDANINLLEQGTMFNDLTLSLATATGTADIASIRFVTDTTQAYIPEGPWEGSAETISGTLTVNGVETINLSTVGGLHSGLAAEFMDGAPFEELGTFVSIRDLDADALRTLNISGSASLSVRGINADNLTVIDARQFTGSNLELGGYDWSDIEGDEIYTDMDLVVHGAAAADHNININGNESVIVTTGTGDDYIDVNAVEEVTINAGSGDNNINVNSYEENVTITTGDGDDNINAYADDDIVINAGSGDNNIFASAYEGDVTITTLGGDDNIDVDYAEDVTINAGNGDNNINIGDSDNTVYEDVTVTTGTGEDDINVYDGEDVTVTSGADEDYIFIDSDINGRVIIDAGSENDRVEVDVDTDVDSFRITLGAGVDTLRLESSADDGEITQEVFVTDFAAGTGGDTLELEETNGDKAYYVETSADGEYTFATDDEETSILEFSFDAVNASSNLATTYSANSTITGAQLLTALGNGSDTATINIDDNTDGYIVAYSGGDAFVFYFNDNVNETISLTNTDGESVDIQYVNTGFEDGDGVDIYDYVNLGDGDQDLYESWTISFSQNGEKYDAGDTITIKGLEVNGQVDFTYIVTSDDTLASTVASAIAALINDDDGEDSVDVDSDFVASVSGGLITLTAPGYGDLDNQIEVIFTPAANLDASDITLVGVMDNVVVGSLITGNFNVAWDLE